MKYLNTFSIPVIFTVLLILPVVHTLGQESKPTPKVSAAQLEQWTKELSNWGRWGKEDERGTLNLITPEKRIQAAALVKKGKSISLAMSMSKEKNINNGDPLVHTLKTSGQWAGDTYIINYHGYAHSHIDALCHIARNGQLFNGFGEETRQPDGARKLGIQHMAEGIFSRGILVDMAWLKGVSYLEPGTAILTEDLEAWERKTGIHIGSGDVLLIRTGRWECEKQNSEWRISGKSAGLHASVAKWLRERDVAVLGSDAASDVFPSGVEGQTHPIHLLILNSIGMPILDNLNLDDLAAEARQSNRWEFLFVGTPLRVEGGTGSPLNPIAIY